MTRPPRPAPCRRLALTLAGRLVRAVLLASLPAATAGAATPAPAAPASWGGLWQGRVAGQDVVVALHQDEQGRWTGRYFYERFGRDLGLWAVDGGDAATLTLRECRPDYGIALQPCDQPSAQWTLTRTAGRAEGQWQATGLPGRRPPPPTPLQLTRVADYDPSAEALSDPYEQRRLKGIKAQRGPGGQAGPVAWDTLTDARSKVAVPQFTRGAPPGVLAGINQQLKAEWRNRIGGALTALDYNDALQVVFANRRWLATNYSLGFYYAGAAHPSSTFSATTFDLSTGQPVDWSRWFRFTAAGHATLDINRRDLLAAQVLKAFSAQQAQATGADADDSCAQQVLAHYECQGGRCASGELTGGQTPDSWHVWPTADGLAVAPDVYSEAARHCRGEMVVLPWKQVRASLLRPQALP